MFVEVERVLKPVSWLVCSTSALRDARRVAAGRQTEEEEESWRLNRHAALLLVRLARPFLMYCDARTLVGSQQTGPLNGAGKCLIVP